MNRFRKPLVFSVSLLIIFSLLLFNNCSNDGDEVDNENNKFIGTWTTSSIEVELIAGGIPFMQYLLNNGDLTEAESELIEAFYKLPLEDDLGDGEIEFKSNNTYAADFGDEPDTGSWSYDSSTGYLTIDSDNPDEDVQMIMVKSITSSTLIIEESETFEEDINGDGTIDEVEASIEMTFTKS